jgi:hypothetical protein
LLLLLLLLLQTLLQATAVQRVRPVSATISTSGSARPLYLSNSYINGHLGCSWLTS